MEKLLSLLRDQMELSSPKDTLSNLINAILFDGEANNDMPLDEEGLEHIQAAKGFSFQRKSNHSNSAPGSLDRVKRTGW